MLHEVSLSDRELRVERDKELCAGTKSFPSPRQSIKLSPSNPNAKISFFQAQGVWMGEPGNINFQLYIPRLRPATLWQAWPQIFVWSHRRFWNLASAKKRKRKDREAEKEKISTGNWKKLRVKCRMSFVFLNSRLGTIVPSPVPFSKRKPSFPERRAFSLLGPFICRHCTSR